MNHKGGIMKKILIMIVCIPLINAFKPSEKDFISIGEAVVRESLKDPDSAKFESFYHKVGDNDGYVCGNVNAKNSYGGYTGRKEYFVFIETESGKLKNNGPVTIVSDSDSNALEKYKLFCQ